MCTSCPISASTTAYPVSWHTAIFSFAAISALSSTAESAKRAALPSGSHRSASRSARSQEGVSRRQAFAASLYTASSMVFEESIRISFSSLFRLMIL